MANSNGYLMYLINLVDAGERVPLCEELFSIPFKYDPEMVHDAILADNAASLRISYKEDTGLSSYKYGICSCLELLVYIAIKMEGIMVTNGEMHPERWFDDMINNLDICDGVDVEDKITRWMNRDFSKSGKGGLFPLKNARQDQRLTPFWQQAGSYMGERVCL